jgi:hypothetical protein
MYNYVDNIVNTSTMPFMIGGCMVFKWKMMVGYPFVSSTI